MAKYRVKQVGERFYPQYKKSFGWGYYKGKPYWDYGASSFISGEKVIFYEGLYFDSLEKANHFLTEAKKSDVVKYHEVKETN